MAKSPVVVATSCRHRAPRPGRASRWPRPSRRLRPSRRGVGAFTLPEILLAATMGALLLIATAGSVGMFGKQLTYIKAKTDTSLESTLTTLSDDIRYAWWADASNPRQLVLADPSGSQTTYGQVNTTLTVKRPDGASGVVLDDVKSVTFTPQTVTRYREATPVTRNGQFWGATAPGGAVVQAKVVEPGDALALGFTPGSPSPTAGTTPGVQEQLLSSTLSTFSLTVASISTVAPILGTVTVNLYRARSPNDARPEGASLGSVSVSMLSLPVTAAYAWNTKTKKKVNVPKGVAWGWWKSKANQTIVVTAPTVGVPIDLSALSALVRPGYAYTLVVGTTISGAAVAAYPIGSATQSGVAFQPSGGAYAGQALSVVRSLSGVMTSTRSTGTAVTNRVLIDIVRNDGSEISGSTMLIGQGMADDTWLGVIPGELGP